MRQGSIGGIILAKLQRVTGNGIVVMICELDGNVKRGRKRIMGSGRGKWKLLRVVIHDIVGLM